MTCVRGALGHIEIGLSYTLVRMSSVQGGCHTLMRGEDMESKASASDGDVFLNFWTSLGKIIYL